MSHSDANGRMPLLDEVLGRFDPESRNPFFGLHGPGGQWPEERSFARTANVYALARLAQVLCGMQGYVLYGGDAGDSTLRSNVDTSERGRFAKAIAETIECLLQLCPEMLSDEPVEVDRETNLQPYIADERMAHIIQRALLRGGIVINEYDQPLEPQDPHDGTS